MKRKETDFPVVPHFTANAPPTDALNGLTAKDREEIRKRPRFQKHLKAAQKGRKQEKRLAHRKWWSENWINVLCALFAFIAALEPIKDFIVWIITYVQR